MKTFISILRVFNYFIALNIMHIYEFCSQKKKVVYKYERISSAFRGLSF